MKKRRKERELGGFESEARMTGIVCFTFEDKEETEYLTWYHGKFWPRDYSRSEGGFPAPMPSLTNHLPWQVLSFAFSYFSPKQAGPGLTVHM